MRYQIPIVYQRIVYHNVEAENLQDAVKQALIEFFAEPDDHYLDDSFEVDGIIEDNYNEQYDVDKAVNEICIPVKPQDDE